MLQDSDVPFYLLMLINAVLALSPSLVSASMTDQEWLAYNIYHESRGESIYGQIAVAIVTINRVESPKFPNSIPSVITQKKQFSWYWDGGPDTPRDTQAYKECMLISKVIIHLWKTKSLEHIIRYLDIDDVKWYHNNTIEPTWASSLQYVGSLDHHNFYKEKQ